MKIKLFWADGHHQVSSTLSKLVKKERLIMFLLEELQFFTTLKGEILKI